MNKPIDWRSIAAPLDVHDIYLPTDAVRRWVEYERRRSGIAFRCETASGMAVDLMIDVVMPDVIRLRMTLADAPHRPSEMLAREDWAVPPFDVEPSDRGLTLVTERLRLEVARSPWEVQAFAVDRAGSGLTDGAPFFRERIDDRAYGPGYEVAPIGFERTEEGGWSVRETIALNPGECLYGLGEKFTPLDKSGQEHVSWAVDAGNVSSYRSYKNIPFLMSTAGYGLFVHSSHPIVYRIGSESSISYSIHVYDSRLDYFLIYGPELKHILRRYSELTGYAPMPPKWSFGFWISRCGYKNRSEVEQVVREMRARGFPCDVISLDPWWMGDGPWTTYEWDTRAFPEPAEMIRGLRQQGVRTCLWIHPYVPKGSKAYEEGLARGFFVRREDGNISPPIESFSGSDLAAIDFTSPEARAWFESKLQALLDMGVAVFKTDFGEQAPVDAVYYDGRSGLEMHNLYPLLYNQTVFELTKRNFGRGLVWARSGYAGSQRYPVQWGGDSYGSLDQMACQMRGLLSYGMSGVPFCSHDVGGFDYAPRAFDQPTQEGFPQDPVVYVRWLQFGVFSSHVRAHGKQAREPWTYGPEAEEIARRYLRLRYRLLPYIYSEAVKCTRNGLPMVRPMVLEYQEDPTVERLDLQYMFGDSFLVAPVVHPSGCYRAYLPAGGWIDYWSKEKFRGEQWIQGRAPLEMLPVWVRSGAIIATGPDLMYTEEKPLDPLTLELYCPEGREEAEVHDEDKPTIAVRYEREGERLRVHVGAAPGQVELVLYGVSAGRATCEGRSLTLRPCHGGQTVWFDGARPHTVEFLLEP